MNKGLVKKKKKNEQGWFFKFEQSVPIGRLLRLDHGTLLDD